MENIDQNNGNSLEAASAKAAQQQGDAAQEGGENPQYGVPEEVAKEMKLQGAQMAKAQYKKRHVEQKKTGAAEGLAKKTLTDTALDIMAVSMPPFAPIAIGIRAKDWVKSIKKFFSK